MAGVACAEPGDPAPVPPEGSAPGFEILDTAGVEIVENARPPTDSRLGWRVGAQPALSIGEVDGPDPYLLDISDVLRLPDGRIIVADRASRELRAFDTLRVHLATWGGSGEGPGEFTSLVHVDPWPGDSLVARWSQGNRLTVFDSQGNYGRVFGIQDRVRLFVETVLPEGLVLASRSGPSETSPDGHGRALRFYEIRGPEGEPGPSIGSFRGSELYSPPVDDGVMVIRIPFSRDVAGVPWGGGHVLGFMETPAGLRVFQIGEDYILGYATDELGVEYVQLWSLSRAGR